MKTHAFFFLLLLIPVLMVAQVIQKPRGCFAGTNGTNPAVLSHPEVRGVLLVVKWSDIEQSSGVFDFTGLDTKINAVKATGLKYAMAVAGGAFGSPDWLIDSLNVGYHNFQDQNQNWRLPFWWDDVCYQKLAGLIGELGDRYAADTLLSHVYVTQMTVNGIEGHLNGIDMAIFAADGFTNQKWIAAARNTTYAFAEAFPEKPVVFEVHEIDHDTTVPATIIRDLYNDPGLCNRIGLGMWWISGKATYQPDLLDFIMDFQGDKYAQVIGRSDQPERFKDSLYSTVFTQAKQLNIRYLEPWPWEFQYHTHDSLMQGFNMWADTSFLASDTCIFAGTAETYGPASSKVSIYPNPTKGLLNVHVDFLFQHIQIKLFNASGRCLLTTAGQSELDISRFPAGIYYVWIKIDSVITGKRIIRVE